MTEVSFKGRFINPNEIRKATHRSMRRRFVKNVFDGHMPNKLWMIRKTGDKIHDSLFNFAKKLPAELNVILHKNKKPIFGNPVYEIRIKHNELGDVAVLGQSHDNYGPKYSLSNLLQETENLDEISGKDVLMRFINKISQRLVRQIKNSEISVPKTKKMIEKLKNFSLNNNVDKKFVETMEHNLIEVMNKKYKYAHQKNFLTRLIIKIRNFFNT